MQWRIGPAGWMEDMMSKATHMEPRNMEPAELGVDKLEQFVRGWFEFFAGAPGDTAAATAPARAPGCPLDDHTQTAYAPLVSVH